MNKESDMARTLGLFRATAIGVGAIVGGGILALAGVACSTTGPGAIVAFALNGVIALITALTFAELSTSFPESGGTYTYAKKVLSVEAAFTVGWMVWFASIVAVVLYALGFASYGVIVVQLVWRLIFGHAPEWINGRYMVVIVALLSIFVYTANLIRKSAVGGLWETVGKVVLFIILIGGGVWVLTSRTQPEIAASLSPMFPLGVSGLVQAMGYTFIALQGFDLIAAVGGEIREPRKTLPRSMFLSLVIALGIYLPLLFVIATVGVEPGHSILEMSKTNPEIIVAIAAQNYLGNTGYWLVIVAAILSMLSALLANLYAASRIAFAMAKDRTLPYHLQLIDKRFGTPVHAVIATMMVVVLILFALPDVAAAGAAASLIFLITFALAHGISILARIRGGLSEQSFKIPYFPLVPVIGILTCVGLALFQGIAVPAAGIIALLWMGFGGILYWFLLSGGARIYDAAAEALDPQLIRLRGRSPLVLVPLANPANAESMVTVADALAPPKIGRVLLLSVVVIPEHEYGMDHERRISDSQAVLRKALSTSFALIRAPEALTTTAADPWSEISRVSKIHVCESMLLGFSSLSERKTLDRIGSLIGTVGCDVVVLRAPEGWRLSTVKRILVPVGGRGEHRELRARLLGSLCRTGVRDITFIRIVADKTSDHKYKKILRELEILARDETRGLSKVDVLRDDAPADRIITRAQECDLVILGLQRTVDKNQTFGNIALRIIDETNCAIIMINQRV